MSVIPTPGISAITDLDVDVPFCTVNLDETEAAKAKSLQELYKLAVEHDKKVINLHKDLKEPFLYSRVSYVYTGKIYNGNLVEHYMSGREKNVTTILSPVTILENAIRLIEPAPKRVRYLREIKKRYTYGLIYHNELAYAVLRDILSYMMNIKKKIKKKRRKIRENILVYTLELIKSYGGILYDDIPVEVKHKEIKYEFPVHNYGNVAYIPPNCIRYFQENFIRVPESDITFEITPKDRELLETIVIEGHQPWQALIYLASITVDKTVRYILLYLASYVYNTSTMHPFNIYILERIYERIGLGKLYGRYRSGRPISDMRVICKRKECKKIEEATYIVGPDPVILVGFDNGIKQSRKGFLIPVLRYSASIYTGLFSTDIPDKSYCGTYYYYEADSNSYLYANRILVVDNKIKALMYIDKKMADYILDSDIKQIALRFFKGDTLEELDYTEFHSGFHTVEDVLDDKLCELAKKHRIEVIILRYMTGKSRLVTEVLDVRKRMVSLNKIYTK